jgi:ribonuclease HI
MKRLEDFPGFIVSSHTNKNKSFNPFENQGGYTIANKQRVVDEKAFQPFGLPSERSSGGNFWEARPVKLENEPGIGTQTEVKGIVVEETREEEIFALFPQPKPLAPIQTSEEEIVPMVQPRGKHGERLLYKHPRLPKVGPKGAYWLLVGTSDKSQEAHLLQFDGGAAPNPGPAGSGAVLWSPPDIDGKRTVLFESGQYLGKATNNIAEVQGLLLGLKIAVGRGVRDLLIEGDSELIVFQQTGKYKVSDKNLKVWWSQIQAAFMDETSFDWIAIRQIPREQNERADSITKDVVSRRTTFVRGE